MFYFFSFFSFFYLCMLLFRLPSWWINLYIKRSERSRLLVWEPACWPYHFICEVRHFVVHIEVLLINYCLTTIVVLDLHGRYDVSRPHRHASDLLLRYVCLSVNHNREPYKTAKPIKMLFGLWTRMGSRNHVVVGESRIHPRKGVIAHSKV